MYFIKKKKPKIEHIVLYNSNNFNTYIQRLIDGTKYLNQKNRKRTLNKKKQTYSIDF